MCSWHTNINVAHVITKQAFRSRCQYFIPPLTDVQARQMWDSVQKWRLSLDPYHNWIFYAWQHDNDTGVWGIFGEQYFLLDATEEHIDGRRRCLYIELWRNVFTSSATCLLTMKSIVVFFATLFPIVTAASLIPFRVQYQDEMCTVPDIKVSIQLGVMSRCPDALLCESTFNEVLSRVIDKVNLSLVYIAK